MVCLNCGASLPHLARFCSGCGTPRQETCTKCGMPATQSSQTCQHCGATRDTYPPYQDTGAGDSISPPVRLPRHLAERIRDSGISVAGERKQITILFADMKGSTNLIQDLDPEQVAKRLHPTIQAMIDAVHRYEGTVNRIEGDGIMALFGAPFAYEDSAVRAAYAALDMQNAVHSNIEEGLDIRVGLHSGEVLVRTVHTDLSIDYDAIGANVHLAARMEQMAEPGCIYCTAIVTRLADGLIETRSLGITPVKGFREPIELFEIVGHTAARTRWEATAARGLTRFVSRERELADLQDIMRTASTGESRLVGIVGDPGTGKSRLVHELLQSGEAANWTVLKSTNASYTQNTPYLAFVSLIRSWCDIPEKASQDEIKRRLHAKLEVFDGPMDAILPALHSILDLQVEDPAWQALEPATRRIHIQNAAKTLIIRRAAHRPLLLWLEDMQWADIETRSLLDTVINEAASSRLLIVMTYRPEYSHAWADKPFFRKVPIEALSRSAATELTRSILGNNSVMESVCDLIVGRTEGIPLFIEETVRALVESGVLQGRRGNHTLARDITTISIPDSVQSVLASRIDRLPHAQKDLLQTASVLGSEVPVTLLEAITDVGQNAFRTLLADLQAADFLYESPNTSTAHFRFKHALTHQVAYGSLLTSRRQELHGRVVRAIETQYAANLAEVIENLAHHAFNGALWREALEYACQAGSKAVDVSAYREARSFYEQALEVLAHLPNDLVHIRRTIDIRLGLRAILGATTEFAALEACLLEAETLAIAIDDSPRLAAISVAQTFVHNWRGDLQASIGTGERGLRIARDISNHRLELSASLFLGQAYMWRGNYRRCRALLLPNQDWTTGPLRQERLGTTGTSSVLWLGMLAASHAYLGSFDDAIDAAHAACMIADEVNRPYDMALAYWYTGFVHSHRGDTARAIAALEHGFQICRTGQISFLVPVLSTTLGYTYVLAGRIDEGMAMLGKAVAFSQSAKFPYSIAWSTVYFGLARLLCGKTDGIRADAQSAIDLAFSHHYRGVEATARRLMASILLNDNEHGAAKAHFLEAHAIASELGLDPEAGHCHTGLAFAFARSGDPAAAARHHSDAAKLFARLGMRASAPLLDDGDRGLRKPAQKLNG